MTSKFVKIFFFIVLGFAIGVIGYHQCGDSFLKSRQNENTQTTSGNGVAGEITDSGYTEYPEVIQGESAAEQREEFNEEINIQRRNAITRAIKQVSPAVVSVNVMKVESYYQRRPGYNDPFDLFSDFFRLYRTQIPVKSVGSGFFVSHNGFVLTNEHVVQNAQEIIVVMNEGEEHKAKIVGLDHLTDIALLKIDKENCPYLRFGNSNEALIGEWAIALGNPFGLFIKSQPTVTVGVISALHRDFSPFSDRIYQDMIQTDAAINNGNSGGPLCNILGQVIGMNTFIYTGESGQRGNVGIGFAIPSNRINEVITDLKKHGKIERDVWIGFQVSDLTPYLARMVGYPKTRGVIVVKLDQKSPAQKAGLEVGDVILKINSKSVNNVNEAQSALLTADPKVGSTLDVTVWRKGNSLNLTIILEKQR
ncbi:MAG: trypsin-like peptidase domain-containing protein [Calditrichaceae bacterium]|nr:trypsin-like peptidase domain-containing protein [Calditrichaceae bacterium]MBN2709385.1 trypsin-like peptidase domain-containing protein [Calditrichaceae bacterium]RQV95758.1 MAG: PDZ domain-containing protein [Calditrichota bacterium]